ncbi:UdgX family uracil-DNA binding protein [Caulobacter sp. KR2-114]|uniref:UdgX family uracil-DNA binding protein n=1 Tax=Caulobacter sp. KR2-114 TaxID=3400912 RepID=UPI003BFFA639
MPVVTLESEIDLAGWRAAARTLRLAGASPDTVRWRVAGGGGDLFADADVLPDPPPGTAFTAPAPFLALAADVVLHRAEDRFDRLYRLLWRLRDEPELMRLAADPEVAHAGHLARAVRQAAHKMQAFVRFRQVPGAPPDSFIAWFEPPHRVVERMAPWFAARYANQAFSILTPEVSAHWDRRQLTFGPGATRADAPAEDALEGDWQAYYAAIFNPARLKVRMMKKEMPQRYWRNLPEARLIPELIDAAEARTAAMVASPATEPARARRTPARARPPPPPDPAERPASLDQVAAGVQACRRCDLWKDATQGVASEGPDGARLMLVGEQPGDQEDLAGRPFVGPAGQMLDRALAEAGADRAQVLVTNAVKHFKHEPQGKRRIHKTPNAGEVQACRWWLDAERALVRPRVIVALGATAALAVFGKAVPIKANRGQALQLPDQSQAVVTYHPSFLLRVPDERARREAYAALVEDLALAWRLAG